LALMPETDWLERLFLERTSSLEGATHRNETADGCR
jgi:hypothetical protein